jgi:hypothetical protein
MLEDDMCTGCGAVVPFYHYVLPSLWDEAFELCPACARQK